MGGKGIVCQGVPTNGEWGKKEKKLHTNIFELKVMKLPLLTFLKIMKMKTIHLQIVNLTTLLHLLKMEGSRKRETDRFDPGNLALQLLQST